MPAVNMIGQRFGRLLVLARTGSDARKHAMWCCRCDCGAEVIALGYLLRRGEKLSCGCLFRESRKRIWLSYRLRYDGNVKRRAVRNRTSRHLAENVIKRLGL